MRIKRKLLAAGIAAACGTLCSPAFAVTQNFTDLITGNQGSVSLTSGLNSVTVTLTDSLATPSSLANLLSDLAFSVTGGQTVSATNYSASGVTLITLADGQATSLQSGQTSNPWTLSGGSSGYLFSGLNGGDQTATLIIGPVSTSICQPTKCPDGLGNPNFNPYISGTATFNLTIPGVTADSTFSNVGFSYGTSGEVSTIPIPAAVWLFGSGLVGLIGIARRKIAPAAAPAVAV